MYCETGDKVRSTIINIRMHLTLCSVLVRPEDRSDAGREDGFDSWVLEVRELRQSNSGDQYIIGVWWLDREHALEYVKNHR